MALPRPNAVEPLVSAAERLVERRELTEQLFAEWAENHRVEFAGAANVCALALLMIWMGADFALFGADAMRRYALWHLVSFVAVVIPYGLYRRSRRDTWRPGSGSFFILYPLLHLNGLNGYLLVHAPTLFHNDALVGVVLTALISTGLIYQFSREQFALCGLCVAALGLCAGIVSEARADCAYLLLTLACAMAASEFCRREFAKNLYERYVSARAMLPVKVARYLAVKECDDNTLALLFGPKPRFVACLCADWLGFYNAGTCPPGEVARLFTALYEHALQTLATVVPWGTYYADWSACELFVTFYSEHDAPAEVMTDALTFAKELAQAASKEVERQTGRRVLFDIGIAVGTGVFGIVGPPQQRKATISAEVAGRARQLEALARNLRAGRTRIPAAPIIMLDAELSARVKELGITPASSNEVITTGEQGGQGAVCIAWQDRDGKAADIAIAA